MFSIVSCLALLFAIQVVLNHHFCISFFVIFFQHVTNIGKLFTGDCCLTGQHNVCNFRKKCTSRSEVCRYFSYRKLCRISEQVMFVHHPAKQRLEAFSIVHLLVGNSVYRDKSIFRLIILFFLLSLYDLANVVPTLAKFYHQASEAYEQACTRHISVIIYYVSILFSIYVFLSTVLEFIAYKMLTHYAFLPWKAI